MKLVALMLLWKRPQLAAICMRRWRALQCEIAAAGLPIRVDLLAVGSEGGESRKLAEEHGLAYVEAPNSPVGAKYNRGLEASRTFDPDGVIRAESDDLFTLDVLRIYLRELPRAENIGFSDLYFLRARDLALSYMRWSDGSVAGGGQVLRRDLLQRHGWRPFLPRDRLLDMALSNVVGDGKGFHLRDEGALLVDVKGEESIRTYESLEGRLRLVPSTVLTDALPGEIVDLKAYSRSLQGA